MNTPNAPRPPHAPDHAELQQIKFALDQAAIVAITDVSGRIKYVNDKFCEISRYGRDELLGQDHRIVNSGFHPKPFIRELWRTIAQGQVWRGELRNRAKDGSIYWVDTTIVPFLNEEGKPWQYMAIRYDITTRKRHEETLQAQTALTALGEMAAVVAHEVRNPLAGIRGGVQVIAGLVPGQGEVHELARDIVVRIDALNAVVGDLLLYARQRELQQDRIDVVTLLTDVTASMRQDPAASGIVLEVVSSGSAAVRGDLDLLRMILDNLLVNAIQAMAGSGRITLSVSRQHDGMVAISIADTGSGIAPEIRDRVFDAFFTTKTRGTGLGLPTARRYVEAHGGTIDLLDRPGGGTIARVMLPSFE
ncbi:MAG TPA: ATP-binding protein [Vicinamibacterales bacterium]|nr:ATP-binding protein [Vicinamibacterales bacterium]